LRPGKKIWLLLGLIFASAFTRAQNESPLLVFSNPIMINPAFAGFDNQTSLHVGNQYYLIDSAQAYNLLYFTYDTYSDKLNGGIGLYFQQGIIGSRNISTSEFGFSYAGVPRKTKNGSIRFAVNANFLLATKHWYVASLDGIMIDPRQTDPNPPGEEFLRYLLLKPRLSFLWDTRAVTWGISAGYPLKVKFNTDSLDAQQSMPAAFTLYISKNREGYKKGLRTRPYLFVPEIIFHYQEDFIISRIHAYIEHTSITFGTFLQSDFTHNIHTLGGTFGIAEGNIRVDLSAGAGVPGISNNTGFCGELSLKLIVPRIDYSKINPWATKAK